MRRQYLVGLFILCGMLGAQGADAQRSSGRGGRPNILYIITDQHTASAMSSAGNPHVSTPNMDRLAAEGVRFTRAYVTWPLCIPSRSSMITGRMPHEVNINTNLKGNQANEAPTQEDRRESLGYLLSGAGYDAVWAGKWHVPNFEIRGEEDGFRSISGMGDARAAERGAQYLLRDRPRDRPFFLAVSFHNPHDIAEWARGQKLPEGPIPEGTTELLPPLPANFAPSTFEPEAIRAEQRFTASFYAAANFTPEQWRQYRYAYYRLVEKVDQEIGKVLDALREAGLQDNTLVIFTADHGDGVGSHRWNQKSVLYEEVVNVPFIAAFPGRVRSGVVDRTHLVSNGLDLLPTLCDYAGVKPPAGLQGRSLRPILEGKEVDWRDHLVVETIFETFGTYGRAVVTPRYKYIAYHWGPNREQLFDLQEDPGELNNLAVEKGYQEQIRSFRKRLHEWSEQTNDFFGLALFHPVTFERPGYYQYVGLPEGRTFPGSQPEITRWPKRPDQAR